MSRLEQTLRRIESFVERLECVLAPDAAPIDWSAHAFRWRRQGLKGWLQPVSRPHQVALDDLIGLESQKAEIARNTRQFVAGQHANNLLLWGARGTGKSSLVKAVFNAQRERGLRLIEVDKDDLAQLPDILELLSGRPERFILFCDDLSFAADESGYKALKATLDGSICATPENMLIYATSNRRHLLPEFHSENREAQIVEGELHHGESVEEKISLSDRFGLWIAFHPFSQDDYLAAVRHWLARLTSSEPHDTDWPAIERAALQWALRRGSRSGRTAWQFARDQAGRQSPADAPLSN